VANICEFAGHMTNQAYEGERFLQRIPNRVGKSPRKGPKRVNNFHIGL